MHKYTNITKSTVNTSTQAHTHEYVLQNAIAFFPIQTDILTKFNIGRRIFFQIIAVTGVCVCVLPCMYTWMCTSVYFVFE